MDKIILSMLLFLVAWVDFTTMQIPNWLVIPGIIVGCYIGGHYFWGVVMFLIFCVNFNLGLSAGGDTKLFTMVGLFLGIKAILVLAGTCMFIKWYREIYRRMYKKVIQKVPMSPFVGLSALIFMW